MHPNSFRKALLAASLLLLATVVNAATVTVSPDNMQGWSIVTNQVPDDNATCTAGIVNYGYAVAQRDPGSAWVSDDGANMGRGAYYVTTSFGGWHGTPPTAWLGVDTVNGAALAGITLNRITKLEYYAFNAQFVTIMTGGADDWESWTWRGYNRHPISLQITVERPNGSGERKTFWYLPWKAYVEYGASACRGDQCGHYDKKWYRYDCTGTTTPGSDMSNRWYCPNMAMGIYMAGRPDMQFPNWSTLKAFQPHLADEGDPTTLGEWKLVTTSTAYDPANGEFKSAGWDASTIPVGTPECNATGMPINFQIGARKTSTPIFLEDTPLSWIRDYNGFRGYMDRFTIGIDGVNTTFNFEPSLNAPAPKVVVANSKAAWDAILYRRQGNDAPAQDRYLVKLIGKIAPGPIAPNNLRASMTDGFATVDASGNLVDHYLAWWLYWGVTVGSDQVRQNPATSAGAWWSVTGIVERSPVLGTLHPESQYIPLWTSPGNMRQF